MPRFDERTALLVVDLQNDFADPAGSLSVKGGEAIVPTVNEALAEARARGAMVVATQDWHPESTPHFAKDGGIWPVHCVAGTWGAELHPAFDLPDGAPRIRKGTGGEDGYCAFFVRDPVTGEEMATELEGMLRDRGVERIVVCGLATDYCVKETAIDAAGLGFEVTLMADAVAAVNLQPGDGDRAIEEMAAAGVEVERAVGSGALARPADEDAPG
jgi:nicotinamidase/pyrazinamidase